MRLRAKIKNIGVLAKLGQSIEKLCKQFVFKLSPTALELIVAGPTNSVQVWSKLQSDAVLFEYRIESLTNNEIYLEVVTEHFAKAFRSAAGGNEAEFRLTKKTGSPVLLLSVSSQFRSGKPVNIQQEIPVNLLSRARIDDLKEPLVGEPDVNILLPNLQHLRSIVDRMKNLSPNLLFSANMSGELKLSVESDLAEVVTHLRNLSNPEIDTSHMDASQIRSLNRSKTAFATVTVDAKDFLKFANSYHVNPSNVVCCIVEDNALVIYVYVGSFGDGEETHHGGLTYYIPVKAM